MEGDRIRFLEILADVVARYGWICHAYCLMTNHYHLLIETPEANLSRGMQLLNGVYTQWFNVGTDGLGICFKGGSRRSLWRRRAIFWSWPGTLC
jgi:REP element-mobilizing transposase RayT